MRALTTGIRPLLIAGLVFLLAWPVVFSSSYDLRVFTLGSRVLAGMRRLGNGSWRTNVAQGGTAEAVEVPGSAALLAVRAAQVLGAEIAGVDLLLDGDDRWHLIEVNACPGWRALEAVTGLDVAGAILEHVWETMP